MLIINKPFGRKKGQTWTGYRGLEQCVEANAYITVWRTGGVIRNVLSSLDEYEYEYDDDDDDDDDDENNASSNI